MEARGIKADHGDVAVYFNVGELLKRADGERMMDEEQVQAGMSILDDVTISLWRQFTEDVKKKLRTKAALLAKHGLTLR